MGARNVLAMIGFGFVLSSLALGCAPEQEEEDVVETKDAFMERKFDWLYGSSIVEPATKGPLKVKVEHDAPLSKQWVTLFEKGMNTWFEPVRRLPGGDELAHRVMIVEKDEDIVLEVKTGTGRGYYKPGAAFMKQRIEIYDSGSYETLLHEIGHAMGLGDTYVEGVWSCKPGQPDSVMCHADASDLRADDIRGIRFEYCKRTKRCDANDFKDTYGGGGGKDFAATCPPGAHLSGLEVRMGWIVDSVTPICEDEKSASRTKLSRIGGAGGDRTMTLQCAKGAWITDISVDHKNWVTGLRADCSDGRILSEMMGSGSHDQYICPSTHSKAVGLRGGAGSWVDRLGLSCEKE